MIARSIGRKLGNLDRKSAENRSSKSEMCINAINTVNITLMAATWNQWSLTNLPIGLAKALLSRTQSKNSETAKCNCVMSAAADQKVNYRSFDCRFDQVTRVVNRLQWFVERPLACSGASTVQSTNKRAVRPSADG